MRKLFTRKVKTFAQDKKGASMVEYAILVGVVALVAAGGATVFGGDLSAKLTALGTAVTGIHSTQNTQ
jgi:Flp pilus assembly pilin Flp